MLSLVITIIDAWKVEFKTSFVYIMFEASLGYMRPSLYNKKNLQKVIP